MSLAHALAAGRSARNVVLLGDPQQLEQPQRGAHPAEDAPRGMRFLYNPNRLNVATGRAQCISILVATRRLLEPECSTPEQMRWANGLCRYRELATEVRLS